MSHTSATVGLSASAFYTTGALAAVLNTQMQLHWNKLQTTHWHSSKLQTPQLASVH